MGLFDKKECAICGGKVKGLFPWQVDGQYICNGCYGTTHVQQEILDNMTLQQYKAYMAFREENQKRKSVFGITKKFDFGFLGKKLVFDEEDGLFCMDADLSSTIFDVAQIEGFAILEDASPLFEGGADGLKQYASFVPDRALSLEPMVYRIRRENANRKSDETAPYHDIPEPFKKFVVEIYLKNNPYWRVLQAEMDGPIFNNSYPDVNDYLRDYNRDVAQMTELAHTLMDLMENAAERKQDTPAEPSAPVPVQEPAAAEAPSPVSSPVSSLGESETITEIKRYKELLDQGIITEEEFASKKKQLMGI